MPPDVAKEYVVTSITVGDAPGTMVLSPNKNTLIAAGLDCTTSPLVSDVVEGTL